MRSPIFFSIPLLAVLALTAGGCGSKQDAGNTNVAPPTSRAEAIAQPPAAAPPEQRAAIEASMARAKADAERQQKASEARNAAPQAPK